MKVSDYVDQGLKNLVEEKPQGYEELGKCTSGCHSVAFFVKKAGDGLEDIKFKATKRCKKLLAVADYVAENIKKEGKVSLDEKGVLEFFKEEKEQDKLKERIKIVRSALGV
ncbi:MAG: nicotinate phosphoribosyltransferase [Acidobacteria bacterium]|jgi:hypothetical protein|nr:MAG: nicotinate phosphoribosyltransferase [Acidobacteriota bacterium]